MSRPLRPHRFRHWAWWLAAGIGVALIAAAGWRFEAPLAAVQSPVPPLAPLPPVSFPPDNPYSDAKAKLGKLLFFDPRMSGDGSMSCSSCHPSSNGSWAIASPISIGYPGTTHWRKSQTLINVGYYTRWNWDGSAKSIEQQNDGAWQGPLAQNLDPAMAEERLAQIPEFVRLFKAVFGTTYPQYNDALSAVATFQRTLVSKNVPFDAYLKGNRGAISDDAKRGYALFTGKARCVACHSGALGSDNAFHNLGVPGAAAFQTNPITQITFRWQQWSRGVPESEYARATADDGLYYTTRQESDRGKFRTPSVRDLCTHAPYMHSGVFGTLEAVLAFYNAGGGTDPRKDRLLKPLKLTAQEQKSLVAFLKSLCGDKIVVQAPPLPAYQVWPNLPPSVKR